MTNHEDDIPPTEPSRTPHAPRTGKPDVGLSAATLTAGADLVPDIAKHIKGIIGKWWYWIGTLPGCPREHLDIGSTDFPKQVEDVRQDKRGKTIRRGQIGSVRQLTHEQLKRIEADLPQCVIRFTDDTPSPGGPGDGLEALDAPRRKGRPVRIPTNEQVEKAIEDGRPLRPFAGEVTDEPAARYIFAQLCVDQDKPQRSDFYPDPLEVTGLQWPEDLKD